MNPDIRHDLLQMLGVLMYQFFRYTYMIHMCLGGLKQRPRCADKLFSQVDIDYHMYDHLYHIRVHTLLSNHHNL